MTSYPVSATPVPISAEQVGGRLMARLARERMLDVKQGERAFYVIPLQDRLLVIFESLTVLDPGKLIGDELCAKVSRDLGGVPVLGLQGRSIYYQIGTLPRKVTSRDLASVKLGTVLGNQPTPLHVPLGMTNKGPAWRHIEQLDSVLIVGPRGSGKTTTMHAWIQALARGAECLMYLWDNKSGNEFGRYSGLPHVTVAINNQFDQHDKLGATLNEIGDLIKQRAQIYAKYGGSPTLAAHNAKAFPEDRVKPVVLFVDEIYFMPPDIREMLTQLVTLGRAYGLYPVLGCQFASRETISGQLDANMSSRVVFHTQDANDSRVAMGRAGAEKLPRIKGRYLFYDGAEILTVQGFNVDLPQAPQGSALSAAVSPVCLLSTEEVSMIEAALRLDGYFRITDVAAAIRRNPKYVSKFSLKWCQNGWLTGILSTTDNPPRRLGRRLTKTLVRMAGLEQKYPGLYATLPENATPSAVDETETE